MRGKATLTKRSRNSYILVRRNVTLQPMGRFSLILKLEMAFFARVTIGCCPVMVARSLTAASSILASAMALPTPILMTIFSRRGTAIGFLMPKVSCIFTTVFSLYSCCRRGTMLNTLPGLHGHALFRPVFKQRGLKTRRLIAFLVDQHDIGNMDRGLDLHDPTLGILLGPALGLFDQIDTLDKRPLFLGENHNDFSGFAFILTGDHFDLMVFPK